jgi:hypothetical protein
VITYLYNEAACRWQHNLQSPLSECMPVWTPLETNVKFEKSREQNVNCPYKELIGGIMYLAIWTRLDISHAVSYSSQFNTCYGYEHRTAAKRVLRYLKERKIMAWNTDEGRAC